VVFYTWSWARQYGSVFLDAKQPEKVLAAYEKAHLWRALFEFAQLQKIESEDIVAMAYRVAGAYLPQN